MTISVIKVYTLPERINVVWDSSCTHADTETITEIDWDGNDFETTMCAYCGEVFND